MFISVPGAGGVACQPKGLNNGLGNGAISAPNQYASNADGYISANKLKFSPSLSCPFLKAVFITSAIP